ncbi:unnamed protein product [Pleuronectes platessa]|uniref:Uncharacterized protein n=1 Tax=Pleuronectes platessa TaxID=8262 RepID=A0A9N7YU79_PLEPL|nr:unnamed protein product [Pleuronectes platessa]
MSLNSRCHCALPSADLSSDSVKITFLHFPVSTSAKGRHDHVASQQLVIHRLMDQSTGPTDLESLDAPPLAPPPRPHPRKIKVLVPVWLRETPSKVSVPLLCRCKHSTGFHRVPLGSSGFHRVPLGSTGFHWVPLGSTAELPHDQLSVEELVPRWPHTSDMCRLHIKNLFPGCVEQKVGGVLSSMTATKKNMDPAWTVPADLLICAAAQSVHRVRVSVGDVGGGVFQKEPGFGSPGGGAGSSVMREESQPGDGPHPPAAGGAHHNRQKVTGRRPQHRSCPHSTL